MQIILKQFGAIKQKSIFPVKPIAIILKFS